MPNTERLNRWTCNWGMAEVPVVEHTHFGVKGETSMFNKLSKNYTLHQKIPRSAIYVMPR
jgi:hypothetical protein